MTEYFQKNLFKDISIDEYHQLLTCLEARIRSFHSGEALCSYDSDFHNLGIIGTGTASVIRYEYNGARTILERLGSKDVFGSMLSYCGSSCSLAQEEIQVVCDTPCQILFLKAARISMPCSSACSCHHQLTQNLLDLISQRALSLSRRVEVLSQRTIREKLLCFFGQLAAQAKSPSFLLPFTMVDLADYLSIDRSAMTRELRRMKEDGLLELEKKEVRLLT